MRWAARVVCACACACACAFACVGCGGRIADDDSAAGTSGDDASTKVPLDGASPDVADAPVWSQPETGTGTCTDELLDVEAAGTDSCSTSQTWSCGSSHYEFRCACPFSTCECFEDGIQKKAIGNYLQCPGCVVGSQAILECGFPH